MWEHIVRFLSGASDSPVADTSYTVEVSKDSSAVLGRGGYGVVFSVVVNGEPRAIKRVPQTNIDTVRREVIAFVTLSPHPNIIEFFGVQYEADYAFMAMELAEHGELFHRVSASKPALDETAVRSIYSQMLSAVSHMHALGVVHRDIKLENWLICRGDIVKLTDFGLAHVYDRAAMSRPWLAEYVGSLAYCMPEILECKIYDGVACDLWSLSICLFAMSAGFFPYEQASCEDWRFRHLYNRSASLVEDIYALYSRECVLSTALCSLLHGCIAGPKRFGMSQMKEHAWTTNVLNLRDAGSLMLAPSAQTL